MQIVTLYGTRSAVASGKSLYRVEMPVGSLIYARDLLRVARENPLVSYPILHPCPGCDVIGGHPDSTLVNIFRQFFVFYC